MSLKFKNLLLFIKNYYKKFYGKDVEVVYGDNELKITATLNNNNTYTFAIKITSSLNERAFVFDNSFGNISDKFFTEVTKKLVYYINHNIELPLSVRLGKKVGNLEDKTIFILSIDGDISNIAEYHMNIISLSEIFYTNDTVGLSNFFIKFGFYNKKIYSLNLSLDTDFVNITDVLVINFGDYFEGSKDINRFLEKIDSYFNRKIILPSGTNFINKYSLSYSNYGNLFYLGLYNNTSYFTSKGIIISKLDIFFYYSKFFTLNCPPASMIVATTFSIEFDNMPLLEDFILEIKKIDGTKNFVFELIFETEEGHYSMVDNLENIDIKNINYKNINTPISVFIYRNDNTSGSKSIVGLNKLNTLNSSKFFYFISSPLSNTGDFSNGTISELKKTKYIFGESIDALIRFYKRLNITYDDKNFFEGDDLLLVDKYRQKNNIPTSFSEIDLIPKVFPNLKKLLDEGQKIYFMTDGGVPCILDPGDKIKKYITINYPEYSIIGRKGTDVISTVISGTSLDYKYIFWTSLPYVVYSGKEIFKKLNFFSKDKMKDTLIIFYSFGKEVNSDFGIFREIFLENDFKINIIGDIGTDREYNRIFTFDKVSIEDISYIEKNLDNIVYLVRL